MTFLSQGITSGPQRFIDTFKTLSSAEVYQRILLLLAICLFAGYFFLDKSVHRMFFYAFLLCGAVFVCHCRIHFDYLRLKSSRHILLTAGLFLGFGVLSLFWSENIDVGGIFKGFKIPIFIVIFSLIFSYLIQNHKDADYKIWAAFLISAAGVALCLMFFRELKHIFHDGFWGQRLMGFGLASNSIILAQLYGVAIFVTLFSGVDVLKNNVLLNTVFKSILCFVFLYIMFSTGSRGPILALGATFFIVCVLRRSWRIVFSICLASIVIGLCAYVVFANGYDIATINRPAYRLEIWMQAIDRIKDSLIWGHGIGTKFSYTLQKYPNYIQNNPHNIILGVGVNIGIIGLILYAGMMIAMVRYSYRLGRETGNWLVLSLIVFGFGCMQTAGHSFYVNINREWFYCWIPFALLLGYQKAEKAKKID